MLMLCIAPRSAPRGGPVRCADLCLTLALLVGSTTAFVSSPANHAPARQYFGAVHRSGGTGPSMVPRRRHSLATLPTMMAVSVPAVLPDVWVVCGALCVHVDALHRTAVCAARRTCAPCGPVPDSSCVVDGCAGRQSALEQRDGVHWCWRRELDCAAYQQVRACIQACASHACRH